MDEDLKKEINKIVDLMIQIDAMRETISELKKEIKKDYEIPVATINKVATILRKQNLVEEDEKWQEIKEYVESLS
jgi:hypothetical protein